MWKNNEYKLNLREDAVLDFERIMLSSGECNFLLPMVFINETGTQTAYYDCKGFTPLSCYRVDNTDDALFIMEKVLVIVSSVVEYLITPSKLKLTQDTVFYNPSKGEIKIAYVPLAESQSNLRRNLLIFISQLKKDIDDINVSYLDRLGLIIHENRYSAMDLVNQVGLMRRELHRAKTEAGTNEEL